MDRLCFGLGRGVQPGVAYGAWPWQCTWLDLLCGGFVAALSGVVKSYFLKGIWMQRWGCDTGLVRTPGWVLWHWPPAGTDSFSCIRRSSASIWSVPFGMLWEITFFFTVCLSLISSLPSVTAPAEGVDNLCSLPGQLLPHSCKKPFPLSQQPWLPAPSSPSQAGSYGCFYFPFFMAFSTLLLAAGPSHHVPSG